MLTPKYAVTASGDYVDFFNYQPLEHKPVQIRDNHIQAYMRRTRTIAQRLNCRRIVYWNPSASMLRVITDNMSTLGNVAVDGLWIATEEVNQ